MQNHVSSGNTVSFTAGATLTGGQLHIAANTAGVIATTVTGGQTAVLHTTGVYVLPKRAATSLAFGTAVAWSPPDAACREPGSGRTTIGTATATAAAGTDTVKVRLSGAPVFETA